jgi:hypothetical protein
MTFGHGIVIEHRFVADIVEGASGDGLRCERVIVAIPRMPVATAK